MKRGTPYSKIHPKAIKLFLSGMFIAIGFTYTSLWVENKQPLLSPLADLNFSRTVYASEPVYDPSLVKPYMIEVFGKKDGNKAFEIVSQCENKALNPHATNTNRNGSKDVGLMQINSIHGYREEDLKDWKFNVRAAYAIYKKAGKSFRPWACAHVIGETPFYK